MKKKEAQFVKSRRVKYSDMAHMFGARPDILRDLERVGYSEQRAREFVTSVLKPWLKRWKQRLRKQQG